MWAYIYTPSVKRVKYKDELSMAKPLANLFFNIADNIHDQAYSVFTE